MGHWDEHLAVQTFINDLLESVELPWLNQDVTAFLMGVAQHEIYDLVVNERPVAVHRIDFQNMDNIKSECPTIYLNLVGIGVSLWKTFKKYSVEHDKAALRRRLLGLLGAVTPDILEGIRLAMLPNSTEAWNKGDASEFHVSVSDWKHPIDTFQDEAKDLERRALLQGLTLSVELFNIEF